MQHSQRVKHLERLTFFFVEILHLEDADLRSRNVFRHIFLRKTLYDVTNLQLQVVISRTPFVQSYSSFYCKTRFIFFKVTRYLLIKKNTMNERKIIINN